jgi:hypothetical protein
MTGLRSASAQVQKQALRDAFCVAHRIAETGVPLFATGSDSAVEVFAYGLDARPMLRRSREMEALLADTVEGVLASPSIAAEGVLYMMHSLDAEGRVVPLYVGKAGRYGRTGEVSANLAAIRANTSKFARWGYNYAYHMGDLSAAALPGHAADRVTFKYRRWAARCSLPLRRRRAYVSLYVFGAQVGDRRRGTSGSNSVAALWPSRSTC